MGTGTGIAWTDATWNPIRGCSRVSEGCRNCYAEKIAARFSRPGQAYHLLSSKGKWTGKVSLTYPTLYQPTRWKAPRRIFVNSMSDLFHERVPVDWIARIFEVMADARCEGHTFQILTKRAGRMRDVMTHELPAWVDENLTGDSPLAVTMEVGAWPLDNVWLGVSVENQEAADARVQELLATPAAVRFLSVEPLLGWVRLRGEWLRGDCLGCGTSVTGHVSRQPCCPDCKHLPPVNWVIVGGESGHGHRAMDTAWLESVVERCRDAGVPVFVKQDSGPRPGKQGRIPDHLWTQEFPTLAGVSA